MSILYNADKITMVGMTQLSGCLRMLALLFKHGKREDLLEYAPIVLRRVEELTLPEMRNTILRKLGVKVVQRIGLTFLKQRVASWRYQRGSRSLADNLTLSKSQASDASSSMQDRNEDDEYDIPDELEEVIEQLLAGLKDKDTIVRWSAAKGIGRITGRLPQELAGEVVGSVLELFTLQESDGSWHGGCLALAELGRRGLLVTERLVEVVPVVLKALAYDDRRGNFSVGAHVRDAACYVCWSFARAYEPQDILPYVTSIASALVKASIFDREVNVRRAAAAAFQENVGRQGTFPHGIDILTTADYYAVGNRSICYLELSVFVAQFPEYIQSLIDHLKDIKISHWDSSVRELTAKALGNLAPMALDYYVETVLPDLLPKTTGIDLYLRHGAILSVSEIIQALSSLAVQQNGKITDYVNQEIMEQLRTIAKKLTDAKLFRGLGGELMRKAVSCMIQNLSLSRIPFHGEPIIELWQEIIDDNLHHLERELATVNAIPAFFTEYYRDPSGIANPAKQEQIVEKYLQELKNSVENSRMGYSLALGAMPKFLIQGCLNSILSGLIVTSQITPGDKKMAEARRDAVNAITSSNEFVSQSCDLNVDVTIHGQRSNIRKQLLVITLVSSFMIGFRSNFICGLGMTITRTSSCLSHVTPRSTSQFTVKSQISKLLVITLVSPFMIGFRSNFICGLGMIIARTSLCLSHVTPRSTKTTANKLYETLVTYDDLCPEETLEEVMTILSETSWDDPVEEVRPIRNKICDLMNVKRPVQTKTVSMDAQKPAPSPH
ncbi:hypothetical protein ScPMuIL_003848 [Solemya velum]